MIKTFYNLEAYCNHIFTGKIRSICWHLLKGVLNAYASIYYAITTTKFSKISAKAYVKQDVIISLTTFPARLQTIPNVLESIFRQTVRPTRIILWLADEQFPNKESVKTYLNKYLKLGLEIKYCDDLKAHKKYYYSIKENPNAFIITFDDDIFAPEDMIEILLKTHNKYPNCIVTQRAHEMKLNLNGELLPYGKWNYLAQDCEGPSRYLCATGGAGCLYVPGALSENAFDIEQIKSLCLEADDIWLKCMSFLKGTKVVLTGVNNPEIIDVRANKRNGLAKKNIELALNDVQMKAVADYYHIDWEKDYGTDK